MQVPQVDGLDSEVGERPLERLWNVVGVTAYASAIGKRPAEDGAKLGSKEDFVALACPLEPAEAPSVADRA